MLKHSRVRGGVIPLIFVVVGLVITLVMHDPVGPASATALPAPAAASVAVQQEAGGAVAALSGRIAMPVSRVYIVGDSITYRSREQVHRRRPHWNVDGVPGRNVERLPHLLAARLALAPVPRHVVVALGANGSLSWGKQDYVDAVALLPERTRVTFTTMWRDPEKWGPPNPRLDKRPRLMRAYTRYVKQIARERPRTCVYNWHRRAKRHTKALILSDGVHPTARGEKVWARGVVRTVKRCAQR